MRIASELGFTPTSRTRISILTGVEICAAIESLIAEAEAARVKAMAEKGGAAAAVSALTAKAKLAGMWRDKVDQHKTGTPAYEHIEHIQRIIVDARPDRAGRD